MTDHYPVGIIPSSTIDNGNVKPSSVSFDGWNFPHEMTFEGVNKFIHQHDTSYEDLQNLCLSLAERIDMLPDAIPDVWCLLQHDSLAHRVADNEWYIMNGDWSFKILDDNNIQLIGCGRHSNVQESTLFIFTTFGVDFDHDDIRINQQPIEWTTLDPYSPPTSQHSSNDDDVAF